jgi:hypothetical protein
MQTEKKIMATPTLADLQRYRVNRAGEPEVVRQSLYDFQVYPTAGQTQLTFFSQPVGQGKTSSSGATAGSAKTRADTNMELAGQLPRFKNQLVECIEVYWSAGSVSTTDTFTLANITAFAATAAAAVGGGKVNDINAIAVTGSVQFFIGSKIYLEEAPIGRFPPKTRLEVEAAVASNSATTAEVIVSNAYMAGRPYYLEPPVVLTDSQNFNVQCNWPVAIATPSGFNGRIGVVLDGYLFRAAQ